VLPALIRKAHEAKLNGESTLTVWGSGTPRREFMHVDDLAGAAVFLMDSGRTEGVFNVGVGEDLSIHDLAETICRVIGFQGQLVFDASKPDGTMRKLLDVSKLGEMGWVASTGLEQGIRTTYQDFLQRYEALGQQPAHA
jgi:GDP-L-fucose synthase